MSNEALLETFIGAWSNKDVDAIMACFTEDAEYINIPIDPPNIGKTAIRQFIEGFISTVEKIEFIVHRQLSDDAGWVMNERTDRLLIGGNWVELPVMGVFEVRNGKIAKWRDYFDMAPFNDALASSQ